MSKHLKQQTSTEDSPQGKLTIEKKEFYSGIVPSADELAKYDGINPGFAGRLISMAELEQRERIGIQNKIVEGELEIRKTGLAYLRQGIYVGFASVLAIIGFCTYLAYLGATTAAASALGITIGLAGIFVIRQYNNKKEDINPE